LSESPDKFERLVSLVSKLPPERMDQLLREVVQADRRLGRRPKGPMSASRSVTVRLTPEQFLHARARADALGLDGVSEFVRELVAKDQQTQGDG